MKPLIAVIAGLLLAGSAQAQVLSPDTLSAWVDMRAVAADGERSGFDGGFGKLRYDHVRGKTGHGEIAQGAVLWRPRFGDDTLTGNVLVQALPDGPTGVTEAYIRWKPVPTSATRYGVRAGQMFPPVSLEHDGPGWTTTRTVTPSMINSWIGEEVLVDGVEISVQRSVSGQRIGLTTGIFMGADTAGTLLTFRGWAQHDRVSGNGAVLPLPRTNGTGWAAIFTRQAGNSRPLVEVDGRAGGYVRFDWQLPVPVSFNLVLYDNPGNPAVVRHGQYSWTTRFADAGLRWQATARDEVLMQALRGSTQMGASLDNGFHPADIIYDAGYVLVCHHFGDGSRLSGRLDVFGISDRSLRDLDDNSEHGHSLTAAWLRPLNAHIDLAVEGLTVHSNRPARATIAVAAQQSQAQLQVALKLHL